MKNRLIKNKVIEIVSYGFWGGMTVLFSIVSYAGLKLIIENFKIANLCSIILTKIFAYIVNKKFVFRTKNTFIEEIKEVIRFIIARGFTGIVDLIGQACLVDIVGIDDMFSKIIMIVITTILNYILCSLKVFRSTSRK